MTKEFLTQLDPPFTKWLPPGIQQELAIEFGFHYAVIGRILRGQEGSDETVMRVYARAKELLATNLEELEQEELKFSAKASRA